MLGMKVLRWMLQGLGLHVQGVRSTVPFKKIGYGAYRDLVIIHPKPWSIYLRGTIGFGA